MEPNEAAEQANFDNDLNFLADEFGDETVADANEALPEHPADPEEVKSEEMKETEDGLHFKSREDFEAEVQKRLEEAKAQTEAPNQAEMSQEEYKEAWAKHMKEHYNYDVNAPERRTIEGDIESLSPEDAALVKQRWHEQGKDPDGYFDRNYMPKIEDLVWRAIAHAEQMRETNKQVASSEASMEGAAKELYDTLVAEAHLPKEKALAIVQSKFANQPTAAPEKPADDSAHLKGKTTPDKTTKGSRKAAARPWLDGLKGVDDLQDIADEALKGL